MTNQNVHTEILILALATGLAGCDRRQFAGRRQRRRRSQAPLAAAPCQLQHRAP